MGVILMFEFVALTFGGAWLAMKIVGETAAWAISGWFLGALVFAMLYSPGVLDTWNAHLKA